MELLDFLIKDITFVLRFFVVKFDMFFVFRDKNGWLIILKIKFFLRMPYVLTRFLWIKNHFVIEEFMFIIRVTLNEY